MLQDSCRSTQVRNSHPTALESFMLETQASRLILEMTGYLHRVPGCIRGRCHVSSALYLRNTLWTAHLSDWRAVRSSRRNWEVGRLDLKSADDYLTTDDGLSDFHPPAGKSLVYGCMYLAMSRSTKRVRASGGSSRPQLFMICADRLITS